MKHFTLTLIVLWGISILAPGVTPADYYLPLQVGNQLVYRAGEEGGSWSLRTVYETIEEPDSIFGKLFYKQVGSEIEDGEYDVHIFHVFWLRKDSTGTIMIGAYALDQSKDLDSAVIYPQEYPFFHEGFIQEGYSSDTLYHGIRYLDTTMSVNETVSTSTGTFYNCIQRRQTNSDTLGNPFWDEMKWYAKDVGLIQLERITPNPHINLLTQINFQTSVEKQVPNEFRLHQNYPNPFNPLTTIGYALPRDAYVKITVFDLKGNQVAKLVDSHRRAGYHKVIWNAMEVVSGIYIYALEIDNIIVDRKKMIILK